MSNSKKGIWLIGLFIFILISIVQCGDKPEKVNELKDVTPQVKDSKIEKNKSVSVLSNGETLFRKKGCGGCHQVSGGGMPDQKKLAANSYADFELCVTKGKPGTAMSPKKLKVEKIKAIHDWLVKTHG